MRDDLGLEDLRRSTRAFSEEVAAAELRLEELGARFSDLRERTAETA